MRIAVIGAGISGMVAAYLLCDDHDLVVYEAGDYLGGHTHTVDVDLNGVRYAVDTGFIVFNDRNYPRFVDLLRRLGVAWQPSNMSFSVKCERTGLEYRPSSLNTLFAQRRNLVRPAFWRMIRDIFRFRRQSRGLLEGGDERTTLRDYLEQAGYSREFRDHFIVPMGAALWSTSPAEFGDFPVRYFTAFFANHGFLEIGTQPRWLTIRGGSRQYVEKLTAPYRDRIRLSCPVQSLRRHPDHVEILASPGPPERFDHVVVAAHSDQALALLADPSPQEKEILGAIPYQENLATLHTDASLLPRRRLAWASWNYHIPMAPSDRVAVTYYMNMLQSISAPEALCVTLNRPGGIRPETVLLSTVYHHPRYTLSGFSAQNRRDEIQGVRRTWYCGAYWGYGFHEDGVASALAVCERFGKSL